MNDVNVGYLWRDGNKYERIVGNWKQMAENFQAYCSEPKKHANLDIDLPNPDVETDPHSLKITFAETPLVCQFRYVGDGDAVLEFGYIKRKSSGKEKFVHTSSMWVRDDGWISSEPQGKILPFVLQNFDCVEPVIFGGFREAAQQAYKQFEPTEEELAEKEDGVQDSYEPDVV